MRTSVSPRRAACGGGWLAAAALGTLAVLGAATAAQAQAAQPAAVAAPLPKPQPIALNLLNWSGSAGFGSRGPAWYQDSSGVVHLQGAVKVVNETGPNAPLIGTLPRAARPAQFVLLLAHSFDGTYASLEISPSGQITAIPSAAPAVTDFSFVSLEGLTYRPTGDGTPIAMNTVNWNGSVAGTFTPAWYTDRYGIVHLQGAVTQTSTSGSGANTIGTLPPAARPSHDVYTIVHTFNGTYADLVIQTSGAIDLINPRPPMVGDYSFVSLESISYRR